MSAPLRGLVVGTFPAACGEQPACLLRIAGITLLERAVRTLFYAGIRQVVVAIPGGEIPQEVRRSIGSLGFEMAAVAPGPVGRLIPESLPLPFREGELILLDGGSLVDRRCVKILAQREKESFCLLPSRRLLAPDANRAGRFRSGAEEFVFAGAARVRPATLLKLDLRSREVLAAGIAAAVAADPAAALDLAAEDDDSPQLRTRLPFVFLPVASAAENPRAKRLLIDASQKRVLDWPAWYLHRPLEAAVTARICEWPVTPNQLTVLTNAVAYLALVLLAMGWTLSGLGLALAVGVLDGVDGKQARVKLVFSRFGHWEHHFDKLYENGWYAAIAWSLGRTGDGSAPAIALAVLVGANVLDIALTGIYEKSTGTPFDLIGPFPRRFRHISGRRNTYLWAFLPFALAGAVRQGFLMMAWYAALSVAVKAAYLAIRAASGGARIACRP
jgi:phosphatidylglycerophosphate synthase